MGLLDNFGSQVGTYLGDKENLLNLASGFASMSGNPNTASIMANIQGQRESLVKRRDAKAAQDLATSQAKNQRNRTATFLRQQKDPRFDDLATALENQQITGTNAWAEYQRIMKFDNRSRGTYTDEFGDMRYSDGNKELVRGGESLTNPSSGVVEEGSIEERNGGTGVIPQKRYTVNQSKKIDTLSDDIRTEMKPFELVKGHWDRLSLFYENSGAVSDYALAVGFAKILDPTSVARQSEVDAVNSSGAASSATKQAIINAINGKGKMPEALRQEIVELARGIYIKKAKTAQGKLKRYEDSASGFGIALKDIYFGDNIVMPSAIIPSVVPPQFLPDLTNGIPGITQSQWAGLSQARKKQLIEAGDK